MTSDIVNIQRQMEKEEKKEKKYSNYFNSKMRIIPAPAPAFDSCRCEAMCSEEPELACEAHQEFIKNIVRYLEATHDNKSTTLLFNSLLVADHTEASAGRLTNGSDLTNKKEKQSMNFLTLSIIVCR